MPEKKVVLVVEDEAMLQKVIAATFEKYGIRTLTARSVSEAEELVKNTLEIDAIWLDHYLVGKENGLDFLAWCKQDVSGKCQRTPFYVVTNTAGADEVATYIHFGAKEYYVKSDHKLEDIVKTIVAHINNPSISNS